MHGGHLADVSGRNDDFLVDDFFSTGRRKRIIDN